MFLNRLCDGLDHTQLKGGDLLHRSLHLRTRGGCGGTLAVKVPADQTISNECISTAFLPALGIGRGSGWAKPLRSTARARNS